MGAEMLPAVDDLADGRANESAIDRLGLLRNGGAEDEDHRNKVRPTVNPEDRLGPQRFYGESAEGPPPPAWSTMWPTAARWPSGAQRAS